MTNNFKRQGLVVLWGMVTLLTLILVFTFGKMANRGTAFLVGILIVGGWTGVFAMVPIGLKRRRYLKTLNQMNDIVKKFEEFPEGTQEIEEMKTLLRQEESLELKNLLQYYLAWMQGEIGEKEEAKNTLSKITGFPKDPVLQEEFLLLKKEMMEE